MTILVMALFLSINVTNIQPVRASGTIYIRADSSIDPPTAPILTIDNITYTLTDNFITDADGIVVERDNIVVDGAGYALQGSGPACLHGIDLSGRSNVTIMNAHIKLFDSGIWLYNSSTLFKYFCGSAKY